MKREIIIIIIILLIIIVGGIFCIKYIERTSSQLVSKLENLKDKIAKTDDVNEDIINEASYIYSEWEKINESWSIIVLHEELDLIETSILGIKSASEEDNLDVGMQELEKAIFLVNHIYEKERICLKNIF